jgi:hypothetical protein
MSKPDENADLEYHSLDGVKGGRLFGTMAKSATGMVAALGRHRACSAAGDHGAVMVWVDDAGLYRGAFQQHWQTINSYSGKSKSALMAWLKVWMPKMRDKP